MEFQLLSHMAGEIDNLPTNLHERLPTTASRCSPSVFAGAVRVAEEEDMAIKKCRGAPEIQGRREEGGSVMTQQKPVQAVAVRVRSAVKRRHAE
uniref:Uncharacterized protein n=1 Tax=Oryza rufipogon TaxID=4529 RepID=A0A0E0NVC5_ORYRU